MNKKPIEAHKECRLQKENPSCLVAGYLLGITLGSPSIQLMISVILVDLDRDLDEANARDLSQIRKENSIRPIRNDVNTFRTAGS